LPVELQRVALKSELRSAIEVGDFAGAAQELNDLETVGLPYELQPAVSVLVGRLNEGMGRRKEALSAYRTAADSWDRPSAADILRAATGYALGEDALGLARLHERYAAKMAETPDAPHDRR
jgi:hypothetical protein